MPLKNDFTTPDTGVLPAPLEVREVTSFVGTAAEDADWFSLSLHSFLSDKENLMQARGGGKQKHKAEQARTFLCAQRTPFNSIARLFAAAFRGIQFPT